MKTILVTGGCGFIGSHTSYTLLKKGYKVLIIDSNINSSEKVIDTISLLLEKDGIFDPKLDFIKGDLRDIDLIDKIFEKSKLKNQPISSVFHFAGLKSVSESITNPLKYWDANVNSSIKLLQIMDKYECRTIVFSSSATVYGVNGGSFINETSKLNPCNPYGTTKLIIEKLLNDIYLNSKKDWKIVSLRYFNPIGAHESGLLGEDPLGVPNNIFPTLNKVAIGEIPKLEIYGNDWPTKDGTGVRDYIHVMDLAEGHINALRFLEKYNTKLLYLNLGTGLGTSVLDLIRTFEKVNKVKINFEFTKRRKGDYGVVVADNSLAKRLFDWQPARRIDEMCRDGWNWQLRKSHSI